MHVCRYLPLNLPYCVWDLFSMMPVPARYLPKVFNHPCRILCIYSLIFPGHLVYKLHLYAAPSGNRYGCDIIIRRVLIFYYGCLSSFLLLSVKVIAFQSPHEAFFKRHHGTDKWTSWSNDTRQNPIRLSAGIAASFPASLYNLYNKLIQEQHLSDFNSWAGALKRRLIATLPFLCVHIKRQAMYSADKASSLRQSLPFMFLFMTASLKKCIKCVTQT